MQVSHLYGFLAAVFREELKADLLRRLRSDEMNTMLAAAGVELGPSLAHEGETELLEKLAVEYAGLFLGPGGHVSPHESVYAEGGTGNLWGAETVAVRRFVEHLGFEYEAAFEGIPDHISVELELMSELSRREGAAWEDGDREQAEEVNRLLSGRAVVLAGKTTLRGLAVTLALSRVVLGNDSGPGHLAAAVGAPVVSIFGPTSEAFGFEPRGDNVRVVSRPLDCRPCSLHGGESCPRKHRRCLEDISPGEVMDAIGEVMR